ncbi:MAG: hypothetical protein Q4D42_01650 [Eubacteriales bacterium]|nr:hypothetical protein [Eubacteriales bacterium]
MHTESEHNLLLHALFDENLLQAVLGLCETKQRSCERLEPAYADSRRRLLHMLTPRQRADFDKIERLFRKNMAYALRFGFCEGFTVGINIQAVDAHTLFHAFTETQLLTEPYMQTHTEYYSRRCDILRSFLRMEQALEQQEALQTMRNALENRLHGVLYHAFFLGYQLAREYIALP